jgi:hypothetical protein
VRPAGTGCRPREHGKFGRKLTVRRTRETASCQRGHRVTRGLLTSVGLTLRPEHGQFRSAPAKRNWESEERMDAPTVTDQPPTTSDGGAAMLSGFQRMRATGAVARSEQTGAINIFGYPEAVRALSDPARFSSELGHTATGENPDVEKFMTGNPLGVDPPRHGKRTRPASRPPLPRDRRPRSAPLQCAKRTSRPPGPLAASSRPAAGRPPTPKRRPG